jgi:NADPH:quinone reductase-like Zn-dependent oxidoreductase
MRALLQPVYGEADTLTVGDAPVPTPAKGQVLVQVAAASVNAADVFLMRGVPRMVRPGNGLRRPVRRRLGMDLAGVVTEIGPGVTRWKAGDAVFGEGIATFAEFTLAKEHQLAALPGGVAPEHAATLPVAGTTAMCAVEVAKVAPGQRVVVTGVAGGVGQFAAQLAALRGAEVIGVCSGRNIERVRALGIENVIDYETQNPLDTPTPYDAVIDNAGGVRIRDWRRVVVRGGAILPNSGVRGPDGGALMRVVKAQWHGLVSPQRVSVFSGTVTAERLAELGQLLATERIRPLIDTMYTLDQAPEALARVGTHHARGKVVITAAPTSTDG